MKLSPVSPRRPRTKKDKGRASLRAVVGIALMGLLALLVNVYSASPDWWASRGVLDAQQVQDQNAAVNVGQIKAMAAKAMDEMDAKFPGGAGPAIHALVQDWRDNKLQHDQSAALNVGQLKAVAKPYYDRLVEVGARPANAGYPWPSNPPTADNNALVNAGQVKNVFSFTIPLINDTDTEGDGMPDGWELANGLNPALDDSLEDNDGDRVPNLFEYKRGTLANDPSSKPIATLVVDPAMGGASTADNIYSTIKEALDQAALPANAYAVIEVKSGVYAELVLVNKAPVLLLGELGNIKGPPVIIGSLTSSAYAVYLSTASVLDGFIIKHTSARSGGGVSVSAGTVSTRRRLVNCMIRGNESSTGGGIYNSGAKLDVVHCTVTGNKGTSSGRGIYNSNASTLNLVNSIVWGNTGSAIQEIYKSSSGIVTVTGGSVPAIPTSIIAGGEHGGINADPQLTPAGWLWSSAEFPSPAINRAGVALASASKVDIHGEPRPAVGTTPDLGADEFKDSNGDGLPDWLEGADDNDGLAALDEYLIHGTNPLLSDTDGDGVGDGAEIAQGTNPLDDYYHALPPILRFVGGGNQWGEAGTVLATPVSLSVNNGALNAPVTFTASNGGLISTDGVSNWQSSLSLLTNVTLSVAGSPSIKVAQFFVKLPDGIGSSSTITASVYTGGRTATAGTWVAAFDPALSPPTGLIAVPTASDTVRLNWTPSDLSQATVIEVSSDGGRTWSTVGVASAGLTFASISGLPSDMALLFRAHTGGTPTDGGSGVLAFAAQSQTSSSSSSGSVSQQGSSSSATAVSKPTLFVEAASFLGNKWGHQGLIDKTNSYLRRDWDAETPWGAKQGNTSEIDPKTGAETISNIVNIGNFVRDTLAGYMQGYDSGYTDTVATKTVYHTLGDTSLVNWIEHVKLDKLNTMDDLIRNMEVGIKDAAGNSIQAAWVPPFQGNFVQEIKPTPQNQYNEYAVGRASALINITYPRIDAASGWVFGGSYEIKKLQYQWHVNSDPTVVVNWFEVFTPYDGTAPTVEFKTWANTEGKTESEPYPIDPSVKNGKKNGVYRVVQVDIDINDTVAANDDIVRKEYKVAQHNYPQWVPCTVKVPKELKLSNVYLTSEGEAIKFHEFSETPLGDDSISKNNLTVPIDPNGFGRFVITGSIEQSTRVGQAKVIIHRDSLTGNSIGSKALTVFWYNTSFEFYRNGTNDPTGAMQAGSTLQLKNAIKIQAMATVAPDGLDPSSPQISDWCMGIIQNVTYSWRGAVYWDPFMQTALTGAESLEVPKAQTWISSEIGRTLDVSCTFNAYNIPKRDYSGNPFIYGDLFNATDGFYFNQFRTNSSKKIEAYYEAYDNPGQGFPDLPSLSSLESPSFPVVNSDPPRSVLVRWNLHGYKIKDQFTSWLCLNNMRQRDHVIPIKQVDWQVNLFRDAASSNVAPNSGGIEVELVVDAKETPKIDGNPVLIEVASQKNQNTPPEGQPFIVKPDITGGKVTPRVQ